MGIPNRIIEPQFVYIKEIQTSGTNGGASTTSFSTRVLNTLENPSNYSWVSLSSNQFTLQPGTYDIEASAPQVQGNQSILKLLNVTDTTDDIIGGNSYAPNAGAGGGVISLLNGRITITTAKTYALQHRVQTAVATLGWGQAASFGVSEIYSVVKITKVG